MQLLWVVLLGIGISFIGSLPLGNLNVMAMHIGVQRGLRKALWFTLGVALSELVYLRITLWGMSFILGHAAVFELLRWVTVIFLLILGIASWRAARPAAKNRIVETNKPLFVVGILMSAANPIQFPFWAGWVVYASTQQWLPDTQIAHNTFALSAGLGTFMAIRFCIYVAGHFTAYLQSRQVVVQRFIAVLFLLMAVYHTIVAIIGS